MSEQSTSPPASSTPPADNGTPPAASAAPPAPSAPPAKPDGVPDKFWDAATGQLKTTDLLNSYTHLEKKLGSGDIPPASVDGYKWQAPEGVQLDEALTNQFKAKALELGLTAKQYDAVMSDYVGSINAMAELSAAECKTALQQVWQSDEAYNENMELAIKAFQAFAPAGTEVDAIGANPVLLQVLATIGRELGEDKLPNQQLVPLADEDADALMKGEAYWNPKHPEHQIVKAKVAKHFEAKFGTAPVFAS